MTEIDGAFLTWTTLFTFGEAASRATGMTGDFEILRRADGCTGRGPVPGGVGVCREPEKKQHHVSFMNGSSENLNQTQSKTVKQDRQMQDLH